MAGKYKKFKTPIYLPNSSKLGYHKHSAEVGNLIAWQYEYHEDEESVYGTNRSPRCYGRVLAEATHDGAGNKYPRKPRMLAVLQLGDCLSHGYIRHVPVDIVQFCINFKEYPYDAFTKWALFGEMPDIKLIEKMEDYGCLRNGFLEKYLDESGMEIVRTPWNQKEEPISSGTSSTKPRSTPSSSTSSTSTPSTPSRRSKKKSEPLTSFQHGLLLEVSKKPNKGCDLPVYNKAVQALIVNGYLKAESLGGLGRFAFFTVTEAGFRYLEQHKT